MELEELAEIIETMIIQHDYPGFEPRALNLGLPATALEASARVFAQALSHKSIYVRLAALRWFQNRSGFIKGFLKPVSNCLAHEDPFVRAEALKTLQRAANLDEATLKKIAELLKDDEDMVRKEAAKAGGKLFDKGGEAKPELISALREAASDADEKVRWKAQKALRKLGAYTGSDS